MEPKGLDPALEFDDEAVKAEAAEAKADIEAAEAAKKAAEPPVATKKEVDDLKADLGEKLKELDALKGQAAIIDKLQELFAGKTEDPKDAFVKKEIRRLVPELDDLDKIKQVLPMILGALNIDAEERVAEKTESAQEHMKTLMADVGLDPDDEKAVGYLEEALTREIKSDPELLKLWSRGNVKGAVNKAFSEVSTKLFAPVRLRTKRGAVTTITESPKASPKGGAPSSGAGSKPKLDFKDTSRDNVKKIHEAAFERLQELTEE